jgi:hypothetical protein
MQYITLGKTGLRVSRLGFGAMRLPMADEAGQRRIDRELAIPMIQRAFAAGLNYIDTAVGYCDEDSQRAVGEAMRGWRDRIVVSTKNHEFGEDEKTWWTHLENSLERLQVQSIDIYNTHGINWKTYVEAVEPRIGKWLVKARDQGLIRHICTSFHDDNAALVKIVDTGFFASVTAQYNLLDRSLEEGLAHAHASGMGVVIMGPVGGGNLDAPSETLRAAVPGVPRIPELAMRFVLANPHVHVALSGMSTMEQVEDNLRTCSDPQPLAEAEYAALRAHLATMKTMAELYCTGCGYCLPCPQDIPIPRIFGMFNRGRVYGLWPVARRGYDRIGKGQDKAAKRADACSECGACEKKCPQKIPIRRQLKEAHQALAKND